MGHGGRADRCGIHEIGKFLKRGGGLAMEVSGGGGGGFSVDIIHRSETTPRQLAVNTRVVDTHVTNPDDTCSNRFHCP